MTKRAEFRAAERQLAEQLAQMETSRKDSRLQDELTFKDELYALMKSYNMPVHTVLAILHSAPIHD